MTRLAIVEGSGFIDEYTHAISRLSKVRISAVVEADPGAAEPLTSLAELKWSTTSWQRLFSNHANEFDAVVIHPRAADEITEIVAAAHQAKKHALICVSPVRCYDALHVIEDSTEFVTMVAQPLRFMHYPRAAYGSLQSGNIGRLGLLRMHNWMSSVVLDQSAASVAEMIVREADLVCWMFDAAPEVVFGVTVSRDRPMDGILFHLGFEGGGMAIVDCNHSLANQQGYCALSLIGSTGAVYADDQHNTNLLIREQTIGLQVREEHDWFGQQLNEFARAIAVPSQSSCTIHDAIRAVDVSNAIVGSFGVGQVATMEKSGS
ncbi:MAG: hypothetical protein KDB27_28175 [Planctomycetales bacterium]|nr:hypothetical protein [Planctomycetales bacterium]